MPPKKYQNDEERRAADRERKRLKRENETEEQRKRRLGVDKERKRIKRANETEDEKEQRLAERRARFATESDDQREEKLPDSRERTQVKLENENEEERERRLAATRERQRRHRQNQNEIKLEVERRKNRERARNRRANMTPEQLDECRKKMRERTKNKRTELAATEAGNEELRHIRLEKKRKRYSEFKRNEPLKFQQLRNKQNAAKRERIRKMDPEALLEQKKKARFQYMVKRMTMSEEQKAERKTSAFFNYRAKRDEMTKEDLAKFHAKQRVMCKRWRESLTGEKKERYKAMVRRSMKKRADRLKAAGLEEEENEKMRLSLRQNYRKIILNETPERRQKRLLGYRINQAKRLLTRKLEKEGELNEEQIKKEVKKLVEKMNSEPLPPLSTLSTYKPRTRKYKNDPVKVAHKEKNINFKTTHLTDIPLKAQEHPISSDVDNVIDPEETISFGEKEAFSDAAQYHNENPEPEVDDIDGYFVDAAESPLSSEPDASLRTSPVPSTSQQNSISEEYILNRTEASDEPTPPPEPVQRSQDLAPPIYRKSTFKEKSWKCPKCGETATSFGGFTKHYKAKHTQTKGKTTAPESLQEKSISATDKGQKILSDKKNKTKPHLAFPFICMKCPVISAKSVFSTKEKLLYHVKWKHPRFYFPCTHCKLLKYDLSRLQVHLKMCSNDDSS